jgi:GNAT superfamily N-acetyltransferase
MELGVKTDVSVKKKNNYKIVWITNKDEFEANQGIVTEFFDLYESPANFPDPDELEPRDNILARVATASNRPHTFLVAYLEGNKVKAGCIAEYYIKSRCVLLTYIFVHPDCRGQGIASILLKEDTRHGIPGLLKHIEQVFGKKVRAVFFESNNPMETAVEHDSIPPAERLAKFYKLGGRRFPFRYCQPPLEEGLGKVDNLFLCIFPALTGHQFVIETAVVLEFLAEFYDGLKEFHPMFEHDPAVFDRDLALAYSYSHAGKPITELHFELPELEKMCRDIAQNEYEGLSGYIYLKELPRQENPKLEFQRASVCLEFVVDESYFEPLGFDANNPGNGDYCIVTHSFETDLFAYSYQNAPWFFTRCYNFNDVEKVSIFFPPAFDFVSEGRQETFFLPGKQGCGTREVEVNVFLNFTYFKKSKIRIWHLVLTSDEDSPLNEYDIIKLTKFFGGVQESKNLEAKYEALRAVQFYVPEDKQLYTLYDLFERLTHVRYQLRPEAAQQNDAIHARQVLLPDGSVHLRPELMDCLKSGIVQIDTEFCNHINMKSAAQAAEFQVILSNLFEKFSGAEEGKKATAEGIQATYKHRREAEYVFEAFCGITLGILDYSRMGYEEVSDTLLPRSPTNSSFLTINRGVMTSFGFDDTVLASSWRTIGINPYLIVPSAVLAHNEYVSIDAENKMLKIHGFIEECRQKNLNVTKAKIRELEESTLQLQSLLDIDFVPNVFQYPTEQDLYNYGMTHRGILERMRRTKAYLQEAGQFIRDKNEQINQEQQEKLTKYQTRVSDAAYVIAGVSLVGIVLNVFDWTRKENTWTITAAFFIALVLIVLIDRIIKRRWREKSKQ